MSTMTKKWEAQDTSWNQHLSELASEVKISPELIWDSRLQLISVFGQEWLETELDRHKTASPTREKGIVGIITNPIVNNAVEVVELAKYLRAVSHQPNFREIVVKLKNAADYEAIRLNLAVGYRLKSIGWTDIIVEPELGDVTGVYIGQKYIVECAMFKPPQPVNKYLEVLFSSFQKYLKLNKTKTWMHVEFFVNPITINQVELLRDIKAANYRFGPTGTKVEIETNEYKITEQELTPEQLKFLEEDRAKHEDSHVDIGYYLANHKPKVPGDIYSVDLDDTNARTDIGYVTFGGLRKNVEKKSTEEQLRIKIKSKKEQTKHYPADTRRMFVFQSKGMIDDESIHAIGQVVKDSIKVTDNIDDVIFLDRRHQTAFDMLRYTSGQYHILTASERVPHLEKMVTDMKNFEYSDWLTQ